MCEGFILIYRLIGFKTSKDHINYFKHSCDKEAQSSKDFQIPLCPLCNNPVPYKRGDLPDHAMSAHIDRDCKSDPAEVRYTISSNNESSFIIDILFFKRNADVKYIAINAL